MELRTEEKRILRKKFNAKDELWRIEAVIHDGNWYDFDKWKRVAKVKDEQTLLDYIEANQDILIKSEQDSYRVGYDEIVRWYAQEGLDTKESIVPNNFPPKLWGNTTETDVFLNAPRRRAGTVSFQADSDEILKRCEEILKGTGKIMPDVGGRHRAFGLSAAHMKNLLSKGLTESEFESLDLKTRSILLQRELVDLPSDWLAEALTFYANTFAPSILKSSMSTISIYLPDRHDIHSQIVIWVITAMKKFNEDASVPFSGYLSSVLRHWPYDLPNEYLGKDLAKFQRDKKRAIDEAQSGEYEGQEVPVEVLMDIMKMDKKEYLGLNSEHENWLATKNATTLTWEDSANEKKGELLGQGNSSEVDYSTLAKISLAAVKAGVDTADWDSTEYLISNIDESDIPAEISEVLSPEYLAYFAHYLGINHE